jgi:2-succinyl-6-hydroxy-2,4-cyclohexadiene-1-carboxylate synthase
MLIETSGIKINVSVSTNVDSSNDLIVFLHGFTGSLKDWDEVRKNINPDFSTIAIDLIGHGLSDSPSDLSLYSAGSITKQIFDVINHFTKGKIILVGYSMGGRAALSFAVKYPEKLKALVLESTSPGIKDVTEKNKRKQTDDELVEYILSNPIENFVDKWINLDLFKSQKNLGDHRSHILRAFTSSRLSYGMSKYPNRFYFPAFRILDEIGRCYLYGNPACKAGRRTCCTFASNTTSQ